MTEPTLVGDKGDEAYCATCSRSFPFGASHCPYDGGALVGFRSARDPLIGRVLDGRYEIRALLGQGGMGAVYRGMQLSVDREVAIKVVHAAIATDRNIAKRFLREARLASKLNAPTIVSIFDSGQAEDGLLYLVMELARGRTLSAELSAVGAMPVPRVLHFALTLCDALDTAHRAGIVHRDLKPGNVIVLDGERERDMIKVLDFGLAKSTTHDEVSRITNTNALLGTPQYMAPEQIDSGVVDARTDLYALGCIIHELLTGTPPFVAPTLSMLLTKHLREPPPVLPDHVPPRLGHLVARLLAKPMTARIQSAAELRAGLLEVLAHHAAPAAGGSSSRPSLESSRDLPTVVGTSSQHAAPVSVIDPAAKPSGSRSRRGIVIACAALVVTAIGIAALMLASPGRSQTATDPATASAADAMPAISLDAGAAVTVAIDAPTIDTMQAPLDAEPAALDAAVAPADAPRRATRPRDPPRHRPVDAGPAEFIPIN